jgi:hypothetical protein
LQTPPEKKEMKRKVILPLQLERLTAVNRSASPFPGRVCVVSGLLELIPPHYSPASHRVGFLVTSPSRTGNKAFFHDGFYFISWYREMLEQNELVLSSNFFKKKVSTNLKEMK